MGWLPRGADDATVVKLVKLRVRDCAADIQVGLEREVVHEVERLHTEMLHVLVERHHLPRAIKDVKGVAAAIRDLGAAAAHPGAPNAATCEALRMAVNRAAAAVGGVRESSNAVRAMALTVVDAKRARQADRAGALRHPREEGGGGGDAGDGRPPAAKQPRRG